MDPPGPRSPCPVPGLGRAPRPRRSAARLGLAAGAAGGPPPAGPPTAGLLRRTPGSSSSCPPPPQAAPLLHHLTRPPPRHRTMAQLLARGMRGVRRLSQVLPALATLTADARKISTSALPDVDTNVDLGLKLFGSGWTKPVPMGSDNLPLSVDWSRVKGAVPSILNQFRCRSSYICAGVTALSSLHFLKTGQPVELSAQHVLDCHTLCNNGCGGGTTNAVFDFVVENGGVLLKDAYPPYTGSRKVCTYVEGDGVTMTGWRRVKQNCEKSLKYTVAHQPVVVSLHADFDFHKYKPVYAEWVVLKGNDCELKYLNHNVVIIGYGTTPRGVHFWLLMNSHGTLWGYHGKGLLARKTGQTGGALGIFRNAMIPVKTDDKKIVNVRSRCQSCPVCF